MTEQEKKIVRDAIKKYQESLTRDLEKGIINDEERDNRDTGMLDFLDWIRKA